MQQATIARVWRGRTRPDVADAYEAYNHEVGITPLAEKALAVQTFREDRPGETWFITLSWWADVASMAAFTGADPTDVHHLPRDAEFLIELPARVEIWELRHSHGAAGLAPSFR
jgi:hypothetical protein